MAWVGLGIIIFIAGIVRGCIGFGFSALVVASATLFMPPATIVPMMILLEIVASLHMAISTWRDTAWRPLSYLILGTAFTTPLGVYALLVLPEEQIKLLIATLILGLSLLLISGWHYPKPVGLKTFTMLGFFSGFCNGAAAVGGLPVATFLTAIKRPVRQLRATMVMFFLATEVIFLVSASQSDLFNYTLLINSLMMTAPMAAGIFIGTKLFHHLNEAVLRRSVILLLAVLSIVGVIRALA